VVEGVPSENAILGRDSPERRRGFGDPKGRRRERGPVRYGVKGEATEQIPPSGTNYLRFVPVLREEGLMVG
jgi:hypothetical protein